MSGSNWSPLLRLPRQLTSFRGLGLYGRASAADLSPLNDGQYLPFADRVSLIHAKFNEGAAVLGD